MPHTKTKTLKTDLFWPVIQRDKWNVFFVIYLDAFIILNFVHSAGVEINVEWQIWKELRSGCDNRDNVPEFTLNWLRKTTRTLILNTVRPVRNFENKSEDLQFHQCIRSVGENPLSEKNFQALWQQRAHVLLAKFTTAAYPVLVVVLLLFLLLLLLVLPVHVSATQCLLWIGNCNRTLDKPADEGLFRLQEKQK